MALVADSDKDGKVAKAEAKAEARRGSTLKPLRLLVPYMLRIASAPRRPSWH